MPCFKTIFLLLFPLLSCQTQTSQQPVTPVAASLLQPVATSYRHTPGKMNGITFVAPPEAPTDDPFQPITAVGASWIAVVPYAFTRPGTPSVRFGGGHWWGERPEGIRETIRLAHAAGLKVMLKPQVWVRGNWTGTLDFATNEDWSKWEQDYEKYILQFAAIADTMQAELFCIGTEFRTSIEKRPDFWKNLIQKVKKVYPGKVTYSSNWDDWDKVPFWNDLDYIGLGGYFPLVEGDTPDIEALRAAWIPIQNRLRDFSAQHSGKPILFTEFGYLSVDGSGWRNWELEKGIESRKINHLSQSNCYEALFSTFQHESWWAGGFLWKWFPNMRGHEGYPERDYTPQGKTGEITLKKWYKGE